MFNQFVETFSVNELAERVRSVEARAGLDFGIRAIENPRKEAEDHYYNPVHTGLMDIGLKPHYLTEELLAEMLDVILKYKSNINMQSIMPRVRWK